MTDDELRNESIRLVRAHIDAINAWDFDKMAELFAEDAVFEIPWGPEGIGRRFEGRDNIMEFIKSVASVIASENLHDLKVDTLHSDPSQVFATYKSDMEINSNPYRNDYIGRWTVRNGRITYFGEYLDPIPLVIATGGKVEPGSLGVE